MTEQQNHLKTVIEQQNEVLKEIQDLNNQLAIKKEISIKLQGIYEYLTGIGVTLQDEPEVSKDKESDELN